MLMYFYASNRYTKVKSQFNYKSHSGNYDKIGKKVKKISLETYFLYLYIFVILKMKTVFNFQKFSERYSKYLEIVILSI